MKNSMVDLSFIFPESTHFDPMKGQPFRLKRHKWNRLLIWNFYICLYLISFLPTNAFYSRMKSTNISYAQVSRWPEATV